MIKEEYYNLIMASLLHDIGKPIQREQGFDYKHASYGYQILKDLNNSYTSFDPFPSAVLTAVSEHHGASSTLDENHITWLTILSDHLSAGADRRDLDDNESEESEKGSVGVLSPLTSIFNVLKKNNKGNAYSYCFDYFDDKTNYLKSIILPKQLGDMKNIKQYYIDINRILIDDMKNLISIYRDNLNLNSILDLIESIWRYVPSTTLSNNTHDISLFNHSKLCAAYAPCLYEAAKAKIYRLKPYIKGKILFIMRKYFV